MSATVEREAPASRALQWVALALVLLSLWVLGPVLAPIAFAGFVVLVANGPYERLAAALHGRRSLAAVIATVVITVVVFAPLAGVLYLAGVQAVIAGHSMVEAVAKAGGVNAFVAQLPPIVRDRLPDASDLVSTMVGWAGRFVSWAPRAVSSVGWFTAEALLAIVSTYYLFAQGPTFVEFLRRVSPLRRDQTEALLSEFRNVALGLFRGNIVVGLFHGVSAAMGYAIFGIGHVFLLGVVTMVASFVPLVGTGLVWMPIVVGLFLAHHTARAIGLLIWCLLIVGAGDNVIRPFVSRGHMALPRFLLFLMLFGGLEAFGAKGLLLGPLIGSLAVTALRLLSRQDGGPRD
jgi:predicted PurR-regulated permease PerM